VKPLLLPPNQFHRFYRGGARIDALRGVPQGEDGRPEDWVGSTATSFGSPTEGLSHLEDGTVLKDLITANPDDFLGADHTKRYGANPALLVKLLDAGERLPVHYHPGRRFARERLGMNFGKTEAWIILEAEPGAAVHVGLNQPVDTGTVRGWVERQDSGEMLAALNEHRVSAGDAILVPAGALHAIGEGILLLELQEPTDLSVLLEYRRFNVNNGTEHLQLGWDAALEALDPQATAETGAGRPSGAVTALLPQDASPYFRAERVRGGAELDASFAILVVIDGEGTLTTGHGDSLAIARGTTALVPYAAGHTTIEGDVDAIRCLPPAPDAEEGRW
jgi:mannose-6-phosphate isomerase